MDDDVEPPRPDPGFHVYVERGDSRLDVTHAVMDVYDVAVGSMDFGSGFLSTEEVGNLRALGAAIGAERFDYQCDKCLRCGHESVRHWRPPDRPCGDCSSCAGFVSPVGGELIQHWVMNPSTSPECNCGWLPPDDDNDPLGAVEVHVREQDA